MIHCKVAYRSSRTKATINASRTSPASDSPTARSTVLVDETAAVADSVDVVETLLAESLTANNDAVAVHRYIVYLINNKMFS